MVKWRRRRGFAAPLARAVFSAVDRRQIRAYGGVYLSDLRDSAARNELEIACGHDKAHGAVGLRRLDIPGDVS